MMHGPKDVTCEHLDRLRAMIEPNQGSWDLDLRDREAIRYTLDYVGSLERTLQMVGFQRDEHREAIDDLRTIRDGTLARWERSLQEVIDAAERAKRKVSQERAELS